MRIDIELVLTIVGLAALFVGSYLYTPALGHLKPEFRDGPFFAVFWAPDRFDAVGQRKLRRAWLVQLAGLAFIAFAVLF
jgi:hypothetical protein